MTQHEVLLDDRINFGETQLQDQEAEHVSTIEFAKRIGLDFNDNLLLNRALTHRSYLNEHSEALEDYERLEFLGDAVLDFVVGAWLYNRYPEMAEGELTRMRSALVYTEQLAQFGRQIKIGEQMKLGRGEDLGGGRDRSVLLCDVFEALIGAIYLDKGLDEVQRFFDPLLEKASEEILASQALQDPKSKFQEWAQSHGYSTPTYITTGVSGPEHSRKFDVEVRLKDIVFGKGSGSSKQFATKAAAQDAIDHLQDLDGKE